MTIRQLALEWWNSLNDYSNLTKLSKASLTEYYFNYRRFNSLTSREIEEIFTKEFTTTKDIVNILLTKREEIEKLIFSLDEDALINYELEQLNK